MDFAINIRSAVCAFWLCPSVGQLLTVLNASLALVLRRCIVLALRYSERYRSFPGEIVALQGAPINGSKLNRSRHEAMPKQNRRTVLMIERGPRVMWRIINAIYEEYCQARFNEMLRLNGVK